MGTAARFVESGLWVVVNKILPSGAHRRAKSNWKRSAHKKTQTTWSEEDGPAAAPHPEDRDGPAQRVLLQL